MNFNMLRELSDDDLACVCGGLNLHRPEVEENIFRDFSKGYADDGSTNGSSTVDHSDLDFNLINTNLGIIYNNNHERER
jgi:hypothetical protein